MHSHCLLMMKEVKSEDTQRAQQAWAPLGAHTKSPTSLGPARGTHKEPNKLGPRSGHTQRAQQAWAPLGAHTKSPTKLGPRSGAHTKSPTSLGPARSQQHSSTAGPRSVAAQAS
ncbi:hypothetical protein THAOC_05367, partial [Thalassiosira oceanica]